MHLCRSSSNVPCLPSFLEMLQNPHVLVTFWQGAQSLAPATRNDIWTSKNRNALRATTASTFLTPQLPKVVRQWCALCILTWKCASRHCATTACNFSSLIWPAGSAPAALANLLFDPPEPQIIGKTQCFATFLPFRASASSFFWLFLFYSLSLLIFLFSLTLSISASHLAILSEVWLLNFLR